MDKKLPQSVLQFRQNYPQIWDAFANLGEQCHEQGGPLDEKSRRLAKLGIAVGLRHEGAVHSATRQALQAGISPAETRQVALLAITTIGWPGAYAALTWIEETILAADG